jgi:ribosomal protein S18 acetylase RimI-like enzyme
MDVSYRPARQEDLEPGVGIVVEAINGLRARHGFDFAMSAYPPAFQSHCLAEDPTGLWVAETPEGLAGFAMSWMSERFWFLAQLFVRPGLQVQGIGQALLSRTLEQARRNGAENHALVTFAYNIRSTGLYIRNGMFPREPLYVLSAPAREVAARLRGTDGHDTAPMAQTDEPEAWVGDIDEKVLGFRRTAHHAFLLRAGVAEAVQIRHGGMPVGYAYISRQGHIGPLAIAPAADPAGAAKAVIRHALRAGPETVSLFVHGSAGRVLAALSETGFRIVEPYVVLSARPFGRLECYMPSNPGYF